MRGMRAGTHRAASTGVVVLVLLTLAGLLGMVGCSANDSEVTTTIAAATETTAAAAMPEDWAGSPPLGDGSFASDESAAKYTGDADVQGGALVALQGTTGQKVISDAQMEIEVESGAFESTFNQALLLADRYGGYIVSSGAWAGGEEEGMKSGNIAIRVPATSFSRALADAGKLGEVKNQQIQTQDVTEEYVDLEARIANSEAQVKALLLLLAKAKTVDDILQVQQVLTGAQQQLEELKGRLRYLDEHTNFSTLTLTMYETGTVIATTTEWGFVGALKDAVRNLVNAVNAIVRGLGVLVPVAIVLGIIAYIVYRIWRSVTRRRRERDAARYQPYPEGWGTPAGVPPTAPQAAAVTVAREAEADGRPEQEG